MESPRILVADVNLSHKPLGIWKEGTQLALAFRELGFQCDMAGPRQPISEHSIPSVAHLYDLIIIVDNYPEVSWKWWGWKNITTPRLFWAIDTHIKQFPIANIVNWVAFNNIRDKGQYKLPDNRKFELLYGINTVVYNSIPRPLTRTDIALIGSHTPDRIRLCKQFNIPIIQAFGDDYVRAMKSVKICFNRSISYDINYKYFEIMASGTFMLTNRNDRLLELFGNDEMLLKTMYDKDEEIGDRIRHWLENEDEREAIAEHLKTRVQTEHSWHSRCRDILKKTIGPK